MVDESIATKVATEERAAYVNAMCSTGLDFVRAVQHGIDGVAYTTTEQGKSMNVFDIITGMHYRVPLNQWVGHYWHSRADRADFLVS